LKWRIFGSLAAAVSRAPSRALATVHSMFDCPEQTHTSPTRMSRIWMGCRDWPPTATVISYGPPAGRGGSSTRQAPRASARAV
jgi:hypothetical protein